LIRCNSRRVSDGPNNRALIRTIAVNPEGTFDKWKGVDKPFQFVAACIELTAAWANPTGFKTHLPVAFDGTCSGIQHLSLLSRDREAGERVNLTPFDSLFDVYTDVHDHVVEALRADDNKWAQWWLGEFGELTEKQKQTRKLVKTPAGTYAYSTTRFGMSEQVTKAYSEIFGGLEPKDAAGFYLARKIQEACKALLPGPTRVMDYIRKLAKYCNDHNRFLTWTSPTGFPCCNRYNKPNEKTVELIGDKGVRVTHKIAEGCLPEIKKRKTVSASSANFTHSMDAAHLIKVVNAANAAGITDVLTIHDSYSCLAPQARRFHHVVKGQLALLYADDHVAELRRLNAPDDFKEPPERGDLDPYEVILATHPFS
jgi:DNA-directed RNA polymerase